MSVFMLSSISFCAVKAGECVMITRRRMKTKRVNLYVWFCLITTLCTEVCVCAELNPGVVGS